MFASATPAVATADEFADVAFFTRSVLEWRLLSFEHDASGINPVLGNPTSVLSYKPLVSAKQAFGVSVSSPDAWSIDAGLSLGGNFASRLNDRDFAAGQVLMRETASETRPAFSFGADARADLPLVRFDSGVTLGAYAHASFGRTELTSYGAQCLAACAGASTIPNSVAVMSHQMNEYSLAAGIGARLPLSEGYMLEMSAGGGVVGLDIADSHLLRKDLGSMPNIRYSLHGLQVESLARLVMQPTQTSELSVSLGADAAFMTGTVQYAPNTASPPPALPAHATSLRVNVAFGWKSFF